MIPPPPIAAVLVLADESASWRLGGLTQLERIGAVLEECFFPAAVPQPQPEVLVWWRSSELRRSPPHREMAPPMRLRLRETQAGAREFSSDRLGQGAVLLLSTRQVFGRQVLAGLLTESWFVSCAVHSPAEVGTADWDALAGRLAALPDRYGRLEVFTTIQSSRDIARAERNLFRSLGKPSDGVVSRRLNRPVSTWISLRLSHMGATPNQATLLTLCISLAGAACLADGGRFWVVTGLMLYQIASMVDGCDGELARVGFRESRQGARFDAQLDRLSSGLFFGGLVAGLWRIHALPRRTVAVAGLLTGAAIGVTILALDRIGAQHSTEQPGRLVTTWLRQRAGRFRWGLGFVSLGSGLIARDGATLASLLIGLIGGPVALMVAFSAAVLLHLLVVLLAFRAEAHPAH